MITNAGALNRKIDIYLPKKSTSSGFDNVDYYLAYHRISAAVKPARGRYYYSQNAKDFAGQITFIIRYRKDILLPCYIVYQGRRYDAFSIADADMCHESLEIIAEEKQKGVNKKSTASWEP